MLGLLGGKSGALGVVLEAPTTTIIPAKLASIPHQPHVTQHDFKALCVAPHGRLQTAK